MARDKLSDRIVTHLADSLAEVVFMHQFDTLFEDHLALIVHHIVEFEEVLSDIEIAGFDFLLCFFECLVDPRVNYGFPFFETKLLQNRVHSVGSEYAHQIIVEGEEEF